MATNAELQAQLTEMTKRGDKAEARVATLTADLSSANERADKEQAERQQAETRADAAEQEARELAASLKAYKGSATRARAQATILKRELSPETRSIGALKAAETPEGVVELRELAADAIGAGPTEIVFSDGRREIRELAPLIVSGSAAWLRTPHHHELNDDILLEPVGEKQQVELRGFALLDEAGEQVGYCELPTPITIGRSQKMRIPRGSIRF